jgi:hypothetical protein
MPYDAVYFWGPWSDEARRMIASVTRRYDTVYHLPDTIAGSGRPWVAVCHRFPDDEHYYFVSRAGLNRTFTGQSPEELAEAIKKEIRDEEAS